MDNFKKSFLSLYLEILNQSIMNKYRISILAALMLCTFQIALFSQEKSNLQYAVSVGNFNYSPVGKGGTVESVIGDMGQMVTTGKSTDPCDTCLTSVRSAICKGVSNVRRFDIVEKCGVVSKETPALSICGTITNVLWLTQLFIPANRENTPSDMYKVVIGVNMDILDAHTGEVVESRTINVTDLESPWSNTHEQAFKFSMARLSEKITKLLNILYYTSGSVEKGKSMTKSAPKDLYINLGSNDGVDENMRFVVFYERSSEGEKVRRYLGRVKVVDVLGEKSSLCRVQNGGKEIKNMLESGEELLVMNED